MQFFDDRFGYCLKWVLKRPLIFEKFLDNTWLHFVDMNHFLLRNITKMAQIKAIFLNLLQFSVFRQVSQPIITCEHLDTVFIYFYSAKKVINFLQFPSPS